MLLSNPDNDPALLRAKLAERDRELAALREEAADAAEAASERVRAARQEAAALRNSLDEARTLASAEPAPMDWVPTEMVAAEAIPTSPPPLVTAMPAATPRRLLRRVVALPIWRLVRPVARPVLWRARSFLTADAFREMAALRAAQEAAQAAIRDAVREAVQEALSRVVLPPPACMEEAPRRASRGGPSHGLGLGDTAAERWLLTVALECGRSQALLDSQLA